MLVQCRRVSYSPLIKYTYMYQKAVKYQIKMQEFRSAKSGPLLVAYLKIKQALLRCVFLFYTHSGYHAALCSLFVLL